MDARLIAWARAVKSRRRCAIPPLWLFTDAARLPDPAASVARLPKGLCGVVLRHDDTPHDGVVGRAALARCLARICRARRLVLVIAGDARLAASLGAGVHLRGGRRLRKLPRRRLITSSAHGRVELVRAARAGARAAFVSPVFPTASHPGAPSLGPRRFAALARLAPIPCLALGGIDGRSAYALPWRFCAGAGAIGAVA